MKNYPLASIAVMLVAVVGCSPAISQPKSSVEAEAVGTTSLTSAEAPLPANRQPLEQWNDAAPVQAAPLVETSAAPAAGPVPAAAPAAAPVPAAAPATAPVQGLDPWAYP